MRNMHSTRVRVSLFRRYVPVNFDPKSWHDFEPYQGKLLQVLALTCNARKILEIGAMAGYSGIWLARALPPDGKLISLEVNSEYAEMAQAAFLEAGVAEHAEVRVGSALDLLPYVV